MFAISHLYFHPNNSCICSTSALVSDGELSNPEFVRDVRNFAASLDLSPCQWREDLYNTYCYYPGIIVDENGEEIYLETIELEIPFFREWIRDFATLVPGHVTPRVRKEAKERVRIIATILKTRFPRESMMWGVRAANDN